MPFHKATSLPSEHDPFARATDPRWSTAPPASAPPTEQKPTQTSHYQRGTHLPSQHDPFARTSNLWDSIAAPPSGPSRQRPPPHKTTSLPSEHDPFARATDPRPSAMDGKAPVTEQMPNGKPELSKEEEAKRAWLARNAPSAWAKSSSTSVPADHASRGGERNSDVE